MTKIQKLLYIAYGTYWAVEQKKLVDESPQAWPYGPVYPKTRKALLNVNLQKITLDDHQLRTIQKDKKLNSVLKFVFDNFGKRSASSLTEWSHKKGSPWDVTKQIHTSNWESPVIEDGMIHSYFQDLLNVSRG